MKYIYIERERQTDRDRDRRREREVVDLLNPTRCEKISGKVEKYQYFLYFLVIHEEYSK